jgi:hypothetical protein
MFTAEPHHNSWGLARRCFRQLVNARRVALELVGGETARLAALSFQELSEKACRHPSVSAKLHENVDDVTVLVDGTPQVLPLALNRDKQLIQIPPVTEAPLKYRLPTTLPFAYSGRASPNNSVNPVSTRSRRGILPGGFCV